MGWFDAMSMDDLATTATWLKGSAVVLGVLTVLVASILLVVEHRLGSLQAADQRAARERVEASDKELQATRAETERLRKELAGRQLTNEQRFRIISDIAPFAGTSVSFIFYRDDAEVVGITKAIGGCVQLAKWNLIQENTFLAMAYEEGIVVIYPPGNAALEKAAGALNAALNEQGLKSTLEARPFEAQNDPPRVKVRVGKRPRQS